MFLNTKLRTDKDEEMDDFSMKGEILRDALDKIAKINQLLGGNRLREPLITRFQLISCRNQISINFCLVLRWSYECIFWGLWILFWIYRYSISSLNETVYFIGLPSNVWSGPQVKDSISYELRCTLVCFS
jgi:hypothetical protein